jgi:hypothetical protein
MSWRHISAHSENSEILHFYIVKNWSCKCTIFRLIVELLGGGDEEKMRRWEDEKRRRGKDEKRKR